MEGRAPRVPVKPRRRTLLAGLLAMVGVAVMAVRASDEPTPFFPLRSQFMATEREDWLSAGSQPAGPGDAVAVEWVDLSALSGERFLRINAAQAGATWLLPVGWGGTGEVRLSLRSRQQTGGRLEVVDTAGAVIAHRSLQPITEWGDFSLSLPVGQGADAGGAQLVFKLNQPGAWELRALHFHAFDQAAWRASVEAREARGGRPKNLLPISRFALGLPQGWTVDRDSSLGDALQLDADAAVVGPSGAPALRIVAAHDGWLRSPAFNAWPNATQPEAGLPHGAALRVRGAGAGQLRVLQGTRVIAREPFTASDDWTTVSVAFDAPAMEEALALELHWPAQLSGLWIDAVQVAPGPVEMFVGRGAAEVALASPVRQALHLPGSPWRIQYLVTGASVGDRLQWTLLDLYGRRVDGSNTLGAGEVGRAVEMDLPDAGIAQRGSFRFNAWVVRAESGEVISPVAEQIVHRIPAPRHGNDTAPQSQFGVHVLPTSQHLYLAKTIGMNWARLHGPGTEINYWFDVEPKPGEWTLLPERLQRYRDAGFSVLGKFTTAPRWASGQAEAVHSYFDMFVAPRDLTAWQRYVKKLLQSYGSQIDVYEVWNEPWLDKFFSARVERGPEGQHVYIGLPDPAAAYADLTRATREALDASDYRPPLIGLNTTTNQNIAGWVDGDEWTRRAKTAGALDGVEILSYHDYEQGATPTDQFAKTRERFAFALGPLLDADGRTEKPIWNTEGSAQPAGVTPGLYRWLLPSHIDFTGAVWEEAERQARYVLAQRVDRVAKVFLYTMHNSHGFTANNSFSVLLAPDGTLHPVGASFAVLAHWIDGLDCLSHERIEKNTTSAPSAGERLLFGPTDGAATVEIFLADGGSPVVLPGGSGWHDLFGNAVDNDTPPRGHTFFRKASPSASSE